jgi:hypothetical protein
MIQMQKTQKKLAELTEVMNKEINEAVAAERAVERLQTIHQQEHILEDRINAYGRHKIFTSTGDIEGSDNPTAALEKNNQIAASVITAIEFLRSHPQATVDDLRRLKLALPDAFDPATLIMIVRCSRIVEKYEAHKSRLLNNIFELARRAPAEG